MSKGLKDQVDQLTSIKVSYQVGNQVREQVIIQVWSMRLSHVTHVRLQVLNLLHDQELRKKIKF